MPDWKASMQRTYEYYVVDPATWKDTKQLKNVTGCNISRDDSVETLGSATIDVTETVGECYIRAYMITIQNGVKERHPLGTFLVQTPSSEFDGMVRTVSMDAYTPLIELKENPPPLGYSLLEDENIMERAFVLTREHARAPVIRAISDETVKNGFVSNTDDTWMSFLSDLVYSAKYKYDLDEYGRILFAPIQDMASLQPVETFADDEISILQPPVSLKHDLFGIPNVVEIIWNADGDTYYSRAVNDDPNSPTSTVSRGREIVHREINPSGIGNPTQMQCDEYAERVLKAMSEVEYSIKFTHGYCDVRVGDCVRINYERAGLKDVKVKITSQSFKCTPDCQVTASGIYTTNLWKG